MTVVVSSLLALVPIEHDLHPCWKAMDVSGQFRCHNRSRAHVRVLAHGHGRGRVRVFVGLRHRARQARRVQNKTKQKCLTAQATRAFPKAEKDQAGTQLNVASSFGRSAPKRGGR